ncbi:MAG: hypothetical protein A2508_08540 [Candidatus Lambdaproteobacteria bacterium RIFOXYD12_FULL_49_8]|uniref:Uncharacterized protein n=1 Tax=Candidatus Lambdaproteobacteria bacterium RIFOXYD2_FULL_50_16 TaxID=1817772 RepID=A0A1F6G6I0_9PROT|nr:MAG: hypothetical protein A2527_11375 [Candidatus Lambdaproteobacteria bacterium RIFOXYD2_FULL_50_16]OGG96512.1 MAG: hypothetical protein A2508_08540 [Candidatus Lambdaproteobacteria bacterium RIFOXYD12_FULL_49_8]
MEILDQIENRIKQAINRIGELQARVEALEEEKIQYEEKLVSLLEQLDQASGEESTQIESQEEPLVHHGFDGHSHMDQPHF